MAGRIDYAVSASLIVTLSDDDGGPIDVIGTRINKTLAGSASYIEGGSFPDSVQGWAYGYEGKRTLDGAPPSGDDPSEFASGVYNFIFFKHTGYKYKSLYELGEPTEDSIHYFQDDQEIALLPPGAAIILPLSGTSKSHKARSTSATDWLAGEYALIS